jgi:hypothetical protein
MGISCFKEENMAYCKYYKIIVHDDADCEYCEIEKPCEQYTEKYTLLPDGDIILEEKK